MRDEPPLHPRLAGLTPREMLRAVEEMATGGREIAISAVVPCYNEEDSVAELVQRVSGAFRALFGERFEIVLVNDGSSDRTWQRIRAAADADRHIVAVDLSRNFGHQLALTAGLEVARGELLLVIDADLQDPPEAVAEMLTLIEQGADVVYGQRISRAGESWFKETTASLFYSLLSRVAQLQIPADTGDFRLMKRKVADALMSMPEHHRFIRGMVSWLGFKQVAYPYHRQARFSGRTNYSLKMMVRLALDAITGFSIAPLRLASVTGLAFAALGLMSTAYALASWLLRDAVPGWASTVILLSVFSSVQLLTIGIMGEYIGRIYLEVKRRPHYIISEIVGGDRQTSEQVPGRLDASIPEPGAAPKARQTG